MALPSDVKIYLIWDMHEMPNQSDRRHYYVGATNPEEASVMMKLAFGYKPDASLCESSLFPGEEKVNNLYRIVDGRTGYFDTKVAVKGWYQLSEVPYFVVNTRQYYINEILKDIVGEG